MIIALRLAVSFLPAPVQALIFGIIALLLVIAVFKIIAMVMDAIPFI